MERHGMGLPMGMGMGMGTVAMAKVKAKTRQPETRLARLKWLEESLAATLAHIDVPTEPTKNRLAGCLAD